MSIPKIPPLYDFFTWSITINHSDIILCRRDWEIVFMTGPDTKYELFKKTLGYNYQRKSTKGITIKHLDSYA